MEMKIIIKNQSGDFFGLRQEVFESDFQNLLDIDNDYHLDHRVWLSKMVCNYSRGIG